MAIDNPRGLYSAGTVVLNTQPEINSYAQMMSRQQSKKDALDQYYAKEIYDLTGEGMRDKDISGGWGKKVNDWQTKYMNPEKRKLLINPQLDNYRTQTEFNAEHRQLLAEAELSKQEKEKEKSLLQLYRDGKLSLTGKQNPETGDFTPGSDMDIAQRIALSIYDPKRKDANGKDPDIMNMSFTHKWDASDEAKLYKNIFNDRDKTSTPDEKRQTFDNKQMTISTPIVRGFTKEAIAQNALHFDMVAPPEAHTYYENMLDNPAYYKAMSDAYKYIHGNDAVLDREHATEAAAILHGLNDKGETIDTKPNKELITKVNQENALKRLSVQDANTMKHIAYSWGFRMQAGENLEQSADAAIAHDTEYAASHGGEVQTSKDKATMIFGSSNGDIRMKDGNYELVTGKGTQYEKVIGTKTQAEAKENIMKYKSPAYKPGVSAGTANPSPKPQGKTYPLPSGKPEMVEQNGYKYKWNTSTGKYEPIK